MDQRKPRRMLSLLRSPLRGIREQSAADLPGRRAPLPALLFLSAAALWLLVSGVSGDPASAAVTNSGFETGDLTGWSMGTVSESVTVVGDDTINAQDGVMVTPLEEQYMVRLGNPQPSDFEEQPMGPNELSQDFTITENVLRFAYNIWTYDYTGYDEFRWEVRLTDTDTVIGSFQTQAWGETDDTSRKTSAWQVVQVDTSAYQGRPARLSFSAGGTFDTLFAFWVYIDSAEETAPPEVVDSSAITVNGFLPSRNPQTGLISITRTPGQAGQNISIQVPVVCPDGSPPTSVDVIVEGVAYPMTKGVGNLWEGSFPSPSGSSGDTFPITLRIICADTTISTTIGTITLIDPSGFVTDAVTTDPIPEATVTLQRLDDSTWTDVNPFETTGDPPSPTISPQVNPQLTDTDGHYGWDVVEGTYRVVVQKDGYVTQTSSSVTVPPPVTDLDIELVPAAATRTLQWAAGWHNAVWTGDSSTPETAFSCADGSYAAAYRYTDAGLERYFPDRTDISNMSNLDQYDAFLILVTGSVTCDMPVASDAETSRMLQWGTGWHNEGWTGADDTAPGSVFACAGSSVAAAYGYTDAGLERYFPGRADISNMSNLDQYDAFLILITDSVSCDMPIGGAPAATPTPTPTPTGLACGASGDSLSEIEETLGFCLDDLAAALGLTRDELALVANLLFNLGVDLPSVSSEGGAWVASVLPFLFLGAPNYDCAMTGLGTLDCTSLSEDWADYTCSISLTGNSVDCTTEFPGFADYMCGISLTTGSVSCTTLSLDWPDYTCSISLADDLMSCTTPSFAWPDYTCLLSLTGDSVDCTTPSFNWPDFECTSSALGELSCLAY